MYLWGASTGECWPHTPSCLAQSGPPTQKPTEKCYQRHTEKVKPRREKGQEMVLNSINLRFESKAWEAADTCRLVDLFSIFSLRALLAEMLSNSSEWMR